MNQQLDEDHDPEMLAEYDFTGGVRGVYAARFAEGASVVAQDPDVAEVFTDLSLVLKPLLNSPAFAEHKTTRG